MRSVYLNIGSNKGDRRANIERAVALVSQHPLFDQARVRLSPYVRSEPVGFASDSEFLNLGMALDFNVEEFPFEPIDVLDATQAVEKEIAPDSPHRNPDGSYRDRIVDIDIVAIDGVTMETERLTLPHPRAEARWFVMQPMAFLAPGWSPVTNVSSGISHAKKSIADMKRDSLETFKSKKKLPLALILDNLRSLNNVGSIFRTSDCLCVSLIALCGITAKPPAPEIHKTALGAEDSVDWIACDTTLEAVEMLRKQGYTIVCLEQVHDSVSLENFKPDEDNRYAIVVGNEVNGVDQKVVDAADVCIEIPQSGTKHSFNVAVSAAIALWHFYAVLNH